jgi:serine/threonine protein kinase
MDANSLNEETRSQAASAFPGGQRADSMGPRCARCGQPLTGGDAADGCLRCSLELALGDEAELADLSSDTEIDREGAGQCTRYGHFEVVLGPDGLPSELGSGAMATTYRATDTVLEIEVALKVIRREVASHPVARARFLREARAAARLQHPNIAGIFHYGEQDGECYYVMELIEGETLAERVRRKGLFNPKQTLAVGIQVARALAAAEACGLVHRDLKPSNLMLTAFSTEDEEAILSEGAADEVIHVKVIDWGLAKALCSEDSLGLEQTGDGFVGTPAFASPEQFACAFERRIDTRCDIYSLGVTLWYLLCGRTPFAGDALQAINLRQQELPIEQLAAANVPGCLIDLLKVMLAVDPSDRPQSARELLELLGHCQRRCSNARRFRLVTRLLQAKRSAVARLGAVCANG